MIEQELFPEVHGKMAVSPDTEGIKYAGSKLKLLPHILALAGRTDARTIFDGFSGTTRVSQAFARCGYQVTLNDIAVWSETFGKCYLQAPNDKVHFNALLAHLNNVTPIDGWYTEHYGCAADDLGFNGKKYPWQIHNTRKLDAIREEIERLNLSDIEKAVALTSLILALDKVDSTLGHFVSYLREWAPRSYNSLLLRLPAIVNSNQKHEILRSDIFEAAKNVECDLAYYDPPYGSNNEKMPPSRVRYASYYHIWTTIILNDKPKLVGKANRRADVSDTLAGSLFEDFRQNEHGEFLAVSAIKELLQCTKAHWILLSYSSGGRATANELNKAISESGKLVEVIEIDYKKHVMANMKWTNEWLSEAEQANREFLFLIER